MGRAAVIWPESCLSHREGANVPDFKNVSRCSKVKVKIECDCRSVLRVIQKGRMPRAEQSPAEPEGIQRPPGVCWDGPYKAKWGATSQGLQLVATTNPRGDQKQRDEKLLSRATVFLPLAYSFVVEDRAAMVNASPVSELAYLTQS